MTRQTDFSAGNVKRNIPSAAGPMIVLYLGKCQKEGHSEKEKRKTVQKYAWEIFAAGLSQLFGLDARKEEILRSAEGKPYLKNHPEICFNLSHSGTWAACAFSASPVGVDVQEIRGGNYLRMAERFLNEEEMLRIRNAEDPLVVFFQIWTEEESRAKGKGNGLSRNLGKPSEGWIQSFVPEEGYVGSVWSGTEASVEIHRLS